MSQNVRGIIIVKKPRNDPVPDKPISFPPLENLHLELLENKKKVKPGATVPQQKRKPPQIPSKSDIGSPSRKEKLHNSTTSSSSSRKDGVTKSPSKEKTKTSSKSSKKTRPNELAIPTISDESELISELGEDDMDEIEMELGESEDDVVPEGDENAENLEDEEDGIVEEEEPEEEDIYAGLSPEEREQKEREEYIWRFRILKKQYRAAKVTIPEYNEHSDLPEMKRTYDRTIRELQLDDAVESYKSYLIYGFMAMEFISTQWVGVDLEGFTKQQVRMMHKYDRLLVELGEKSYTQWGMNLPVEVRLLGVIILQAGVFYLGKVITSKYGGTISELFKGISGQPPDSNSTPSESTQPKKMRGPKIRADDIRKMSHAQDV
jgi:hypothetical protein